MLERAAATTAESMLEVTALLPTHFFPFFFCAVPLIRLLAMLQTVLLLLSKDWRAGCRLLYLHGSFALLLLFARGCSFKEDSQCLDVVAR